MKGLAIPTAQTTGRMLAGLLGVRVGLRPTKTGSVALNHRTVAVYVDAGPLAKAVVTADLALACALGGALARLSAAVVNEAVARKAFPPEVAENSYEVFNVMAALLNGDDGHVRMARLDPPGTVLTTDVARLITSAKVRVLFDVEVEGYGGGKLALMHPGDDARATPRLPHEVKVAFRVAGSEIEVVGQTVNVSAGGIFIRTPTPLAVGDEVWVELRPPASDRLVRLSGRVAWQCRGAAKAPPGFGVNIKSGLEGDVDRFVAGYMEMWRRMPQAPGASAGLKQAC